MIIEFLLYKPLDYVNISMLNKLKSTIVYSVKNLHVEQEPLSWSLFLSFIMKHNNHQPYIQHVRKILELCIRNCVYK